MFTNPFKIEKTVCVCLDKRKDLWKDLIESNKDNIEVIPFICGDGTDPDLVYNQIDETQFDPDQWGYGLPNHKINHYNAFLAHQKIIRECKQGKVRRVLLLEDDAYFTQRYQTVMSALSGAVPNDFNFDLMYLGWSQFEHDPSTGLHAGQNLEIEKRWKESRILGLRPVEGMLGGLHGVIIDENMYDILLDFPPVNPIDWQLNQWVGHHNLHSYFIYPKVIGLKTCLSMTENRIFPRDEI